MVPDAIKIAGQHWFNDLITIGLFSLKMQVAAKDPRSMEVYTRVFALDIAATLTVPFTGDGRDAADILRSLPPEK